MRCGKCWGEGHVGNRCTSTGLNLAAMPYWSNKAKEQPKPSSKSFQELLDKPCPLASATMPANRPARLSYYAPPDQSTKNELLRLSRAVVFDTHGNELGFSMKDITGFATITGIVEEKELTIGRLAKDRFLIVLPVGMAPETFINCTCPALWDAGFSFQPWSPLDNGKLTLPEYKVLLDISGCPPHMCKEHDIARATALFGTYLGWVPNKDPADVSSWRVAVAVDRLERVPLELELHVEGVEFMAKVTTYNWKRSPLYTAAELPKIPPKFIKPRPSASNGWQVRDEPIAVSRSVLLELCQGKDIQTLPKEIREMLQSIPDSRRLTGPAPATMESGRVGIHAHDTRPLQHTIQGAIGIPAAAHPAALDGASRADREIEIVPPEEDRMVLQSIPAPIQILRRSPVKGTGRTTETRTPSGRNLSGSEASESQPRQEPLDTCAKDKKEVSRTKATRGQAGGSRTQSGPSKLKQVVGAQIMPKSHAFKKQISLQIKSRRARAREPAQKATVSSGQDGFIHVNVDYAHISALGAGLGIQTEIVSKALDEDNVTRRANREGSHPETDMQADLEGIDMDFNPDPEDTFSEEESAAL